MAGNTKGSTFGELKEAAKTSPYTLYTVEYDTMDYTTVKELGEAIESAKNKDALISACNKFITGFNSDTHGEEQFGKLEHLVTKVGGEAAIKLKLEEGLFRIAYVSQDILEHYIRIMSSCKS